jgi:hypothetical protein
MADKDFDPDDPMELVGVELGDGSSEQMAECLVEEYVRDGWDDENLLRLFHDPFYRTTYRICQEKGDEYILALISRTRQKWGCWRRADIAGRLQADEVKKRMLSEVKGDG